MKEKKNSIKGIAQELGVSVTTVSFVLNGKAKEKRISDVVAKKITNYIELIGYRPNKLAQSLRTGKSKIIVCMVEDLSNNFFAKLARLIEDIANEKDYTVLFCSTDNDDQKSINLIDIFKERQVDGFIIIPSPGIENKIASLQNENIPVVLCDRYFPDLDSNYVIIDNENAAYEATIHLIKNNFENIAFITTDVDQAQMIGRQKGYKSAIENFGLNSYILPLSYKERISNAGSEKFEQFLIDYPNIDAVFFSTNYLTKIGLAVIKSSVQVSTDDIGIVTFDDNELFNISSPTITAVAQPLQEMANEVMITMLNLLENEKIKTSKRKVILSVELIIRESSLVKS